MPAARHANETNLQQLSQKYTSSQNVLTSSAEGRFTICHDQWDVMEVPEPLKKRTRDGCWTCRKRKKKCDGAGIPCGNCTRLGLECENRIRLVWEDDARRAGMSRRGPTSKAKDRCQADANSLSPSSRSLKYSNRIDAQYDFNQKSPDFQYEKNCFAISSPASTLAQLIRQPQISAYPRALDSTESLLLSHYIERFSREYPTCSGPTNPFLSVFIPLAMKCSMVLDSLLALSGAQRWQHGVSAMEKESLRLRQRALKGARDLLLTEPKSLIGTTSPDAHALSYNNGKANLLPGVGSVGEENLIFLLTSSILFLLFEKVSGETTWKPHMDFIYQFFERSLPTITFNQKASSELTEAIRFLHDIFVYNDLVRATSTKTKPLSNFYLSAMTRTSINCGPLGRVLFPSEPGQQADFRRRYCFPNLIARLSCGDLSVTEDDITAWDGSMDWLPSFALGQSALDQSHKIAGSTASPGISNDQSIISKLYRTAAYAFRLQALRDRLNVQHNSLINEELRQGAQVQNNRLSQLAGQANCLVAALPDGSTFENALLWPIGITAKELTSDQVSDRSDILLRLRKLEARFQMRHFRKVQDVLIRHWAQKDIGLDPGVLLTEEDAILLG